MRWIVYIFDFEYRIEMVLQRQELLSQSRRQTAGSGPMIAPSARRVLRGR